MLALTIPPPTVASLVPLHVDQAHLLQDVLLGIGAGIALVVAYVAFLRWVASDGDKTQSRPGRETQ